MHGAVKLLLFVPLPRTSICLLVNKANSTNQIISILFIRMSVFYAMFDSFISFTSCMHLLLLTIMLVLEKLISFDSVFEILQVYCMLFTYVPHTVKKR